ncbi:prepilin-type N-terminal cleavage/methylation domain-containing protein [bacterium]|nr:MAG: prepilin-type N-terminal cleavage/methylation domain-containing protein [bacterium]
MKKQGFTLIELVMVIVIIGILAAVAIPRFANLRSDAQQAACDGNVGAIRGAIAAFYAKTAVSPTWTDQEDAASGFPRAITASTFLNCFIMGGALPACPASGAIYAGDYTASTGVITDHNH